MSWFTDFTVKGGLILKASAISLAIFTFVFAGGVTANAQAIAEGFDNITTLPAAGWVIDNNSTTIGTTTWFQGTATLPSHTGAANSYIAANFNSTTGANTISNWLIVPNRTLKNGDVFTFFTRTATANPFPDRLQVRLSTAGAGVDVGTTATDVGTFTTLLLDINPAYATGGVYPETYTQFTITISGLAGPTSGRLAFRYFVENGGPDGANSNFIGIDTFVYTPTIVGPTPTPTPTPTPMPTPTPTPTPTPGPVNDTFVDLNGDGRTDFSVVRTTGGAGGQATWYNLFANAAGSSLANWGLGDDSFLTGDIDGDKKDDMIVWRPGVQATFYVLTSGTNTVRIQNFGLAGDDPTVVADYDNDGKDDFAVYRAGNGTNQLSFWYYATAVGTVHAIQFGYGQDFPAPGDYDGDGRSDFVVQRGEGVNGRFYKRLTTAGYSEEVFGANLDIIVPGDYDFDGKTDVAVVTAVGGFVVWKYEPSGTAGSTVVSREWGISATDFPVQGDYNGDGRTDFAVWRPGSQSTFYVSTSVTNNIIIQPWGLIDDIAVGNSNAH